MEQTTSVSNKLALVSSDYSDAKAKSDSACRNFLAEKQIMARILKDCVEEFRDIDLDLIISSAFPDTIY